MRMLVIFMTFGLVGWLFPWFTLGVVLALVPFVLMAVRKRSQLCLPAPQAKQLSHLVTE